MQYHPEPNGTKGPVMVQKTLVTYGQAHIAVPKQFVDSTALDSTGLLLIVSHAPVLKAGFQPRQQSTVTPPGY